MVKVFKLTELSKVFMGTVYLVASHNHSTTATPFLWKKPHDVVVTVATRVFVASLNFLYHLSNCCSFHFFRSINQMFLEALIKSTVIFQVYHIWLFSYSELSLNLMNKTPLCLSQIDRKEDPVLLFAGIDTWTFGTLLQLQCFFSYIIYAYSFPTICFLLMVFIAGEKKKIFKTHKKCNVWATEL